MAERATPRQEDTPPPGGSATRAWADVLISFRWPLVALVLLLVPLVVYLETLRQAERAGGALGDLARGAAERAERIAGGFLTGNVTERFLSSIPEIASTGSGHLELATLEVTETFSRSDERRAFWDVVYLGTTVSEIKVPVTYRYHLRLADPWRLEVAERTCIVYAPEIRPTQPPAIHTDGLEKRVEEGWLRFDGADQLADLERSITPRLRELAGDPRHLALVREAGRRTVAEFVRNWLLMEDQWGRDGLRTILVVFPGEETEAPESIGPIRRGEG